MATSMNGDSGTSSFTMEELNNQFHKYQDNIRNSYLFVEVSINLGIWLITQKMVRKLETMLMKHHNVDGEMKNYMHKIRDLERENSMLKERVKKDDQAMVLSCL
jgi:hypothetical protein